MSSELVPTPQHTGTEVASDVREAADQLMHEIAASVALLPALPPPNPSDRYHLRSLTTLWLLKLSDTSRAGYFQTLADWLAWCERHELDPCSARRADADAWVAQMTAQKRGKGNVITHVPASRSTIGKRLAVVSSWYKYLSSNDITTGNPAGAVDRPAPPKRSRLPALAADETSMFLDWLVERAERLGTEAAWRDCAQLHLMFATGLRVTAACLAEFEHIGFEGGFCVLRYRKKVKGRADEWDWVPLAPDLLVVLNRYWAVRAERESREQGKQISVDELSGYLFVSTPHPRQPERTGGRPFNQKHVDRRLETLARQAGVKAWKTITPHSTRRTAGTLALANGATLAQVQDLLGHADPRTTRGYDDSWHRLETSPVFTIAAVLRREHQKHHGEAPTPTKQATQQLVAAARGRGES